MAWRRMMGAVAMGVALLLVSVAASAHAPDEHHAVAGTRAVAADPAHAGCVYAALEPAAGYRLHCHFSSLPPLADGAKQSRSHDRTAAPATAGAVIALHVFHVMAPAVHSPIVGPPNYILFGNFRS